MRGSTVCGRWSSVRSCIYGPRQFGIEDQGWLAWMTIAAVTGRRITIYGDGKQVRDVLHVEDLMNAYDAAVEKIDVAKGQIYNMGGGTSNVMAVWAEFGPILERLLGKRSKLTAPTGAPATRRFSTPTSAKPSANSAGNRRSTWKRASRCCSIG
jgi:CDP-paratose 2-epimerase